MAGDIYSALVLFVMVLEVSMGSEELSTCRAQCAMEADPALCIDTHCRDMYKHVSRWGKRSGEMSSCQALCASVDNPESCMESHCRDMYKHRVSRWGKRTKEDIMRMRVSRFGKRLLSNSGAMLGGLEDSEDHRFDDNVKLTADKEDLVKNVVKSLWKRHKALNTLRQRVSRFGKREPQPGVGDEGSFGQGHAWWSISSPKRQFQQMRNYLTRTYGERNDK